MAASVGRQTDFGHLRGGGHQPDAVLPVTEDLFREQNRRIQAQPRTRSGGQEQRRIRALESKLRRKDEVIAEVTEELVRAKKTLGPS